MYVDIGQSIHAVEADTGRELFAMDSDGYGIAPAIGDGVALFAEDGAVGAYDLASAGTANADAAGETDATTATGRGGSGGPGGPPDRTFRTIAAEETADDPEDPDDEAVRAVALGVLVDAWHEEFTRNADLAFEVLMEFVGEASGDGWWIDAALTDHGRQLFEELR